MRYFSQFFFAVASIAQTPPAIGYEINITDGYPVRQLEYTSTWIDPSWRPGLTKYLATFEFSLDPVGNTPHPATYEWQIAFSEADQNTPIDSIIIEDRPGKVNSNGYQYVNTAQAARGLAWYPGVYKVRCIIGFTNGTFSMIERNVAVVGGRSTLVKIKTKRKRSNDYLDLDGNIQPPWRDSEVTPSSGEIPTNLNKSPYYIQFFGRTPGQAYEIYEQIPQSAAPSLQTQPDGSSIEWIVPGFITKIQLPFVGVIFLGNTPGLDGEYKAKIMIDFEGETYGPFYDDTKDDPQYPHSISCHQPGYLYQYYVTPGNWTGAPPNQRHGAKQHDLFYLNDSHGYPMPGVVIQERFENFSIPGFVVNSSGYSWTTNWEYSNPILYATGWQDSGEPHLISLANGFLNGFDNLSYIWGVADPNISYSATHRYWAGSTDAYSVTGIPLSTYTMTFTRDNITNNRDQVTHTGN